MFGKNKKEIIELSQFVNIDEVQVDNVDELLNLLEDANSDFQRRQKNGHLFIEMKNKKGEILHRADVDFPYSEPGSREYVEDVFSFLFEKPNAVVMKIGEAASVYAGIEEPEKAETLSEKQTQSLHAQKKDRDDELDEDMVYEIPRSGEANIITFTQKDLLQELGLTRAALAKLDKTNERLSVEGEKLTARLSMLSAKQETLLKENQYLRKKVDELSEKGIAQSDDATTLTFPDGMSKLEMIKKLYQEISKENEAEKQRIAEMKARQDKVDGVDKTLESVHNLLNE